ncbi:hypothetical protein KSP35_13280 [Aquihabitans sp. G128]|nr:hypothetical protein [Aquihabitans sp. G128]QXC63616.1 hypothetical protein KSP35_13280 [Aquihabitans sp. G128]
MADAQHGEDALVRIAGRLGQRRDHEVLVVGVDQGERRRAEQLGGRSPEHGLARLADPADPAVAADAEEQHHAVVDQPPDHLRVLERPEPVGPLRIHRHGRRHLARHRSPAAAAPVRCWSIRSASTPSPSAGGRR